MGMFDRVTDVPITECPHCGAPLTETSLGEKVDWQTKDGPCDLLRVHYTTVSGFYTNCPENKCWIYYVRKGKTAQGIEDYVLQSQETW